eukprot:g2215.t1
MQGKLVEAEQGIEFRVSNYQVGLVWPRSGLLSLRAVETKAWVYHFVSELRDEFKLANAEVESWLQLLAEDFGAEAEGKGEDVGVLVGGEKENVPVVIGAVAGGSSSSSSSGFSGGGGASSSTRNKKVDLQHLNRIKEQIEKQYDYWNEEFTELWDSWQASTELLHKTVSAKNSKLNAIQELTRALQLEEQASLIIPPLQLQGGPSGGGQLVETESGKKSSKLIVGPTTARQQDGVVVLRRSKRRGLGTGGGAYFASGFLNLHTFPKQLLDAHAPAPEPSRASEAERDNIVNEVLQRPREDERPRSPSLVDEQQEDITLPLVGAREEADGEEDEEEDLDLESNSSDNFSPITCREHDLSEFGDEFDPEETRSVFLDDDVDARSTFSRVSVVCRRREHSADPSNAAHCGDDLLEEENNGVELVSVAGAPSPTSSCGWNAEKVVTQDVDSEAPAAARGPTATLTASALSRIAKAPSPGVSTSKHNFHHFHHFHSPPFSPHELQQLTTNNFYTAHGNRNFYGPLLEPGSISVKQLQLPDELSCVFVYQMASLVLLELHQAIHFIPDGFARLKFLVTTLAGTAGGSAACGHLGKSGSVSGAEEPSSETNHRHQTGATTGSGSCKQMSGHSFRHLQPFIGLQLLYRARELTELLQYLDLPSLMNRPFAPGRLRARLAMRRHLWRPAGRTVAALLERRTGAVDHCAEEGGNQEPPRDLHDSAQKPPGTPTGGINESPALVLIGGLVLELMAAYLGFCCDHLCQICIQAPKPQGGVLKHELHLLSVEEAERFLEEANSFVSSVSSGGFEAGLSTIYDEYFDELDAQDQLRQKLQTQRELEMPCSPRAHLSQHVVRAGGGANAKRKQESRERERSHQSCRPRGRPPTPPKHWGRKLAPLNFQSPKSQLKKFAEILDHAIDVVNAKERERAGREMLATDEDGPAGADGAIETPGGDRDGQLVESCDVELCIDDGEQLDAGLHLPMKAVSDRPVSAEVERLRRGCGGLTVALQGKSAAASSELSVFGGDEEVVGSQPRAGPFPSSRQRAHRSGLCGIPPADQRAGMSGLPQQLLLRALRGRRKTRDELVGSGVLVGYYFLENYFKERFCSQKYWVHSLLVWGADFGRCVFDAAGGGRYQSPLEVARKLKLEALFQDLERDGGGEKDVVGEDEDAR